MGGKITGWKPVRPKIERDKITGYSCVSACAERLIVYFVGSVSGELIIRGVRCSAVFAQFDSTSVQSSRLVIASITETSFSS